MDTLNAAVAKVQAIVGKQGAGRTPADIIAAAGDLNAAVAAFTPAVGNYNPSGDTTNLGLFISNSPTPESGVGGTTLADTLTWLQSNAVVSTTYTIVLVADESSDPLTLDSSFFNGQSNITFILKGYGIERTIDLDSQGSLFTVETGVTLVLDENIILKGRTDNNASLVYVYGGNLEMWSGSKITGNATITYNNVGGVYVNGGTFTVSGGAISGNTGSYSGGVYVNGGTFTMHRGK
ncbi:MAG: hypothetical protein LBQ88_01960 [Treponema sp.]|jgi:hypothetical protein|nr:hypothetical protein [Treponema sp.]